MAGDPSAQQGLVQELVRQVGNLNDLLLVPSQTQETYSKGDLKYDQIKKLIAQPGQTPEDIKQGNLGYTQVRDLTLANQETINQLVTNVKGDGTKPSWAQVQQYVMDAGPMLPQLAKFTEAGVDQVNTRLTSLKSALGTIMSKADQVLRDHQEQATQFKYAMGKELFFC